jgi:hypothetical protein
MRHCRSIIVHCAGLICTPSSSNCRALCLARAEDDDSIVRLIDALDDAAPGGCSRMRRPQGSVSSKSAVAFWRIILTTS